MNQVKQYLSIFSPSSSQQRQDNFENYWDFTQQHSGDLLESEQDLTKKRAVLAHFKANPITLRQPFAQPEAFYRNYVELKDDVSTLDRKTLLLTCIYKFARHEWVGITGAWAATPDFANSKDVTDRISRYHLAEEFSHTRLFHEMFCTLGLDKTEWVPLGPIAQKVYEFFPKLPEDLMSPFAFVTELMGIMFYRYVDNILDEVFADEPEACARLRELLNEITIDELAHIGQRRNYIGDFGIKVSAWITPPLFKMFFHDIPETKLFFNIDNMIKEALVFDYKEIPTPLMEKTWVPSYCVVPA
ncbi:hypothetical protein [Methylomonas sp. AM2-LC]|uniref:hypothetical protein n=1 Tax=Methylomonas sp. AM2-LC TaxID=3153301 RepID=UPI003264956A